MEKLRCRKCGAALAERESRGRPATFCSTACRRASEFELRRANVAIDAVEKRASQHREQLAVQPDMGLYCCGRGSALQRHLDWLEAEATRLELRMRQLLDDGEATP